MRQTLLFLFTLLGTATIATAQMPRTVTVQGIISDLAGTTVLTPEGDHSFRWELRNGTSLIDEGTVIGNVDNGVFNVNIGPFDQGISFDRPYDLVIIYTSSSGTHTFRTPLHAVPYALHADSASNARVADRAVVAERVLADSVQGIPPVGAILPYFGIVDEDHPLPDGWLLCDGKTISESVYPELTAILRSLGYGHELPNLQGMFLRGADLGTATPGYEDPDRATRLLPKGSNSPTSQRVGTVQTDTVGAHSHEYSDYYPKPGSGTTNYEKGSAMMDVNGSAEERTTAAEGAIETRPNNMYVNYIIRAR